MKIIFFPKYNDIYILVSYVEIYNEKVYDLLEPKEYDLPIREDQCRNIIISNLSEKEIKSYEEFQVIKKKNYY